MESVLFSGIKCGSHDDPVSATHIKQIPFNYSYEDCKPLLVQHITDNPHATGKSASAYLASKHQITLSVRTSQRYIKQIHVHRYKARLYSENKSPDYIARVQWAHDHKRVQSMLKDTCGTYFMN